MGEGLRSLKTKGRRLAEAIDAYTQEGLKEIGKSKAQVARFGRIWIRRKAARWRGT